MSSFWPAANASEAPSLPRPTIVRDGPPPARIVSEEERDSWQSPYYRKSARLRASTKEDLPWPARVQMVNGVPLRYQKAYLADMNKAVPREDREDSVPPAARLRNSEAQAVRRAGHRSTVSSAYYDGSTVGGSSHFSPRSHTFPPSHSEAMFTGTSPDLGSSPSTAAMEYLTGPRPASGGSFMSRRHSEPASSSGMSNADKLALEQYAQALMAKISPSQQAYPPQEMQTAPPSNVIDMRDRGRTPGAATSVSIPYSGRQSGTSHALSQARYGQGAPSAYPAQQAMSIAGLSQATGAGPKRRGDQRYEMWANHDYFRELQLESSQRGMLCCCCE